MELFCGTKSFSKVAGKLGHSTFTVDMNKDFEPDWAINICDRSPESYPECDVLWASPPCQTFSIAAISKHWNTNYTPKSKAAIEAMKTLKHLLAIIDNKRPRFFFIENPVGMLRKVKEFEMRLNEIYGYSVFTKLRRTINYCQYGDTRMKPTDIWTNCFEWIPKARCSNGDKCHESAPRGSKTGTQGLENAMERGRIPSELFYELFDVIENSRKEKGLLA